MTHQSVFTIREAVARGTDFLKARGIETARLDAELLVGAAVNLDRLGLYLDMDRPLTDSERAAARELLRRRGAREPVAYILGRREFRSRDFEVTRDTLIPRPETEELVDIALAQLDRRFPGSASRFRLLDIGTGTGVIAISLALELPAAVVVATERSAAAAGVARRNAAAHGVNHRVDIRVQDGLAGLEPPFHAIVSNPPYIRDDEYAGLMPEVRDFEPREALTAGADGLDVVRMILAGAPPLLVPDGFTLLEIGCGQGKAVAQIAAEAGFHEAQIVQDFAGLDRYALLAR
ncbi:MAG: peptide chain release factor N(5)-glutamine methyltransferase [Candidatus Sumerlaeaceae bacterium]|nr:peptide chain release factor N(5)-glutamine methyltransferase [Candidatus Sumerlaeaceae bacterium]